MLMLTSGSSGGNQPVNPLDLLWCKGDVFFAFIRSFTVARGELNPMVLDYTRTLTSLLATPDAVARGLSLICACVHVPPASHSCRMARPLVNLG